MRRKDEIYHYASEYYDPVKAHEYYEAHKKLKGRSSSKSRPTLNQEGQKIADYVNSRLQEERDSKIQESRNRMDNGIENARNTAADSLKKNAEKFKKEIEEHNQQTQNKINELSKLLTRQISSGRAEIIRTEINTLRDNNVEQRKKVIKSARKSLNILRKKNEEERNKITKTFQESSEKLRNTHAAESKSIQEDYENKYNAELDKISSEAKYTKSKRRR